MVLLRGRESSAAGPAAALHGEERPPRGHRRGERASSDGAAVRRDRGERGARRVGKSVSQQGTTRADQGKGAGATISASVSATAGGSAAVAAASLAEEPSSQLRRQEPEEHETRWQTYLQGEEFLTFHAVIESLLTLPPVGQIVERRVDFELLLHLLHRLGRTLEVEHMSKNYRAHYSPDVQLDGYLYSTLLTALTLLSSYVLNGQEFYVSDTVLDQCKSLQHVFEETCTELKQQFLNLQPYSLEHIRHDVRRSLVYFDRSWCRFEMPALEEIEAIHRQACRPLIEAIEAEQALTEWEKRSSAAARSCPPGAHRTRADVHRTRLMEKICELNKLANIDGKGRGDMDLTPILEAERIAAKPICAHLRGAAGGGDQGAAADATHSPDDAAGISGLLGTAMGAPLAPAHKCSGCVSPVLLRIARSLLRALERLRRILQKYANCLYQLNSHLANNPDLVKGLERFEAAWETASRYLVQSGPRRLALLGYDIVAGIREPGFHEALTSLDPGFLVASLPRAFILHEMQRFLAVRAAALASQSATGSTGSTVTLPSVVKPSKGETIAVTVPSKRSGRLRLSKNHHSALGAGGTGAGGIQSVDAPSSMLPRPLETRPAPASAFQFSAISRSFLPPDVATEYDAAAVTLGRLAETKVERVWKLLVSLSATTSPVGSSGSTPLLAQAAQQICAKQVESTPAPAAERPPRTPCPPRMAVPNSCCTPPPVSATLFLPGGTGPGHVATATGAGVWTASAAGSGGATAPSSPMVASAHAQPPTPVVGPVPAVSGAGAPACEIVQLLEEDDSDEEAFKIDLRSVEITGFNVGSTVGASADAPQVPSDGGACPEPGRCGDLVARLGTGRASTGRLGTGPRCNTGPRCSSGRLSTGGGNNVVHLPMLAVAGAENGPTDAHDPDARRVVSLVSTLALHLQRNKPHEWNELIQVVLQGLMLAQSVKSVNCQQGEPKKGGASSQLNAHQRHHAAVRQPIGNSQEIAAEVW